MGDATDKRILIKGGAAGQCQNPPAVRFDGDGSTDHSIRGPEVVDCHQTVRIEEGTLVAAAIGSTEACVNSIHHQAVRAVAPGMRAAGWTSDGIIEVLDPDDHAWPLLAVQWHPEYLAANDDEASLALFMELVKQARIAARTAG